MSVTEAEGVGLVVMVYAIAAAGIALAVLLTYRFLVRKVDDVDPFAQPWGDQ